MMNLMKNIKTQIQTEYDKDYTLGRIFDLKLIKFDSSCSREHQELAMDAEKRREESGFKEC